MIFKSIESDSLIDVHHNVDLAIARTKRCNVARGQRTRFQTCRWRHDERHSYSYPTPEQDALTSTPTCRKAPLLPVHSLDQCQARGKARAVVWPEQPAHFVPIVAEHRGVGVSLQWLHLPIAQTPSVSRCSPELLLDEQRPSEDREFISSTQSQSIHNTISSTRTNTVESYKRIIQPFCYGWVGSEW